MTKKQIIILLLALVSIVAIGVTVWAIWFREADAPIPPDYPPQGTEENQTPIEGDNSNKLESPTGGGAINITYDTNVTVDLSENQIKLTYVNPNASNQNVAILIMIDDLVIAKSDLINPGNMVETLKLEETAKSKLQAGGYNAMLVVRAYDPQTNEKAMVDTKGEITVTVIE